MKQLEAITAAQEEGGDGKELLIPEGDVNRQFPE